MITVPVSDKVKAVKISETAEAIDWKGSDISNLAACVQNNTQESAVAERHGRVEVPLSEPPSAPAVGQQKMGVNVQDNPSLMEMMTTNNYVTGPTIESQTAEKGGVLRGGIRNSS